MAPSSNHSDSSTDDGNFVAPAASSQIQGISIRHHVPVILDMDEGNFGQWRHFFESTLEKFGIESHVFSTTPDDERDGEWRRVDSCVKNWILATVSKGVFDIVRRNRHDAFSLWHAVEDLFEDNELQRAVYLETELRSVMQGDMSMMAYCTKLKRLADQLSDIGHPVSEPSQVLNLLRGLNPRYRYVKPVITSKSPPHTFQSARSFLLLEELSVQHDAVAEATQALTVTHGDQSSGASSGAKDGSSSSSAPRRDNRANNRNGNSRYNNRSDRRRGRNNGNGNGGGSRFSNNQQPGQWTPGHNPWQGLVQAWSMPFRAPGAGVLGPRPPFQPQQAMAAYHQPPPTPGNVFNNSALYAALHSAGNQQPPQSASDWYFDTGATSHMSSSSGNFHPSVLRPFSSSIIVGNGARLLVTHQAQTLIPTATSPLRLNDVLISPSLIKNLISVRCLTRDNNVSIEFDPSGFSIKDLPSRAEMLRCESSGDLYPLRLPHHQALTASAMTSMWHQRLGHPGHTVTSQILQSFDFQCNKADAHSCSSCRLGKHTRLPFNESVSQSFFLFSLFTQMFGPLRFLVTLDTNTMLFF
jgi:hypothetical protein